MEAAEIMDLQIKQELSKHYCEEEEPLFVNLEYIDGRK